MAYNKNAIIDLENEFEREIMDLEDQYEQENNERRMEQKHMIRNRRMEQKRIIRERQINKEETPVELESSTIPLPLVPDLWAYCDRNGKEIGRGIRIPFEYKYYDTGIYIGHWNPFSNKFVPSTTVRERINRVNAKLDKLLAASIPQNRL